MSALTLVWLKRDLRVEDHAPLAQAAAEGPCLPLFVFEPELLEQSETDASHVVFVLQSLEELRQKIRRRGGRLLVRVGSMPDVLGRLRQEQAFGRILSHEETGNAQTYARDRRVAAWCRTHGVEWTELPQHGVFRPHPDRDGWAGRWRERMSQPLTPAPEDLVVPAGVDEGTLPTLEELGLAPSSKDLAWAGGVDTAHETLRSFLEERGRSYRSDMSSPVTAFDHCSRLSPHLAYGNLSVRQVFQATNGRAEELRRRREEGETLPRGWLTSLAAFSKRLRWHCHFVQKLEDQPSLEFENMSRAYDGLREDDFDEERFCAWCDGRTGYPMVDACMRALHRGGWINFRMRAMLMSFASYHLWLHWRPTAVHLARHFLDFEPGIHFPQCQMQSGTTGINAIRIYSPRKQVLDQDPRGDFIRLWCPELEGVPDEYLPEPHTMPPLIQREVGCRIGRDYPAPIVDHEEAYRSAREKMYARKATAQAREEAQKVYEKHGSRRPPSRRRS